MLNNKLSPKSALAPKRKKLTFAKEEPDSDSGETDSEHEVRTLEYSDVDVFGEVNEENVKILNKFVDSSEKKMEDSGVQDKAEESSEESDDSEQRFEKVKVDEAEKMDKVD